ncbi:DUF2726 domain-containing protein [Thiohalophilus thiocyanatoxydans]|uniref:Uncharacterized protein DUF2726 n=1 Tax=Thiohalophilus thiocyanatoxydans TaxID=381308 RepID=A0A4R8J1V0_9GAMM|nr:DUF2726 domain-containing protein [Thiohalophilus thiocyanatoxydans]TDY03823.1 uncharacterized protein DUF2726 [Thiohalophilus thiocyanatoxydans]
MEWVIVLLVLVVIVSVFLKSPSGKDYNYRQRRMLFTPAERSFLGVLDQAISDKYRVFGKVRVADIITPAKGMSRKNWQIAFNRISAKHFDYVLCSKDKLEVIAVIELDDKSHNTKKANDRDSLLENACKSASLSLIRFQAKSNYQIQNVRDHIELVLNPGSSGSG